MMYERRSMGPGEYLAIAVITFVILIPLFAMFGGDTGGGTTDSNNTTTTHVASDNQVNILSVVNNNYGSQQVGDTTTSSRTDVAGNGNVVVPDQVDEWGNRQCWEPNSRQYTYGACAEQVQPVQP